MKAAKLFLVFVLAAGTATALAAPEPAKQPSDPMTSAAQVDTPRAERGFVVQNQLKKHELQSRGFPQYTY